MSKFDEIRNDVNTRGKSLLVTVADIIESITKQNLAFASDFAGFAVAQVRLPTQADDLADYRDRSKAAYSKFGGKLKGHGKNLIAVLREVPGQVGQAEGGQVENCQEESCQEESCQEEGCQESSSEEGRLGR
jgi:hypothetical protein